TPGRPHPLHTPVHRSWPGLDRRRRPTRPRRGGRLHLPEYRARQWRPGAPVGRCRDRGETVAESYNGYCVKCKEKRDFEGEVKVSESGRRMAQGTCPVCGTKMNRILGKA